MYTDVSMMGGCVMKSQTEAETIRAAHVTNLNEPSDFWSVGAEKTAVIKREPPN